MSLDKKKYRLVTRGDFDGLVCAVLLRHLDVIDEILFVHAKDMQDGIIPLTGRDITANLPYMPGVHLAFDHHLPETLRREKGPHNHIIDPEAPSAARVVAGWYGGSPVFPDAWSDMMAAVDKGELARFSQCEVLDPQGWDLLNVLMDARTGLGRFKRFRISGYNLMMDLIDYCRNLSIGEILQLPDVLERSALYAEHSQKCKDQIQRCAVLHKNLVVLDLRREETLYAGNRFIIYALYPEANISIHVLTGLRGQNTVFATGKSIMNRSSATNIGALMREYGGSGSEHAGTCQVSNGLAEDVLQALIQRIVTTG